MASATSTNSGSSGGRAGSAFRLREIGALLDALARPRPPKPRSQAASPRRISATLRRASPTCRRWRRRLRELVAAATATIGRTARSSTILALGDDGAQWRSRLASAPGDALALRLPRSSMTREMNVASSPLNPTGSIEIRPAMRDVATERHRRSVQLRPRPAGADSALGRRGRPADARRSSARRPRRRSTAARPSTPPSAAFPTCARRSRPI